MKKNIIKRRNSIPFLISLTPLIFIPYLRNSFYLPKLIWIFLTTILLFATCIKDNLFRYRNVFILPAGLLFIWSLIALTRCINIFEGIHSILVFILFITFYVLLENFVAREVSVIDIFITYLIGISFVVSLYGLFQVAGIDFLSWEVRNSALSTLGRRNFAAEYLVMVIPYVYYLVIKERRWWLYIVLISSVMHLIFTFTRASYLGFFVSSVLFFMFYGIKIPVRKRLTVVLIILLLSRICFSGVKTFEPGTVKSRLLIWNITLKMIRANPVIGVGPGNFFINYPYYGIGEEEALRGVSLVVDRAHNDYLEVCAEEGIVGLILFLYLLYSFFRVAFILYREADRESRLLMAGIICSVVGICVNALASFPFNNPSTQLLFWVNVSFAGGLYRKVRGERPVKMNYSLLKIYLAVFIITGSIVGIMGIRASRYMYIARNTKNNLSLQFAERAILYNPFSFKYLHFAGTTAMNLNDYQKAYDLLTRAAKLHPYYDSTRNNLGLTYLFTGNLEKAEEEFLTALKLNPDSYEFNNNIGFLYLITERYDEAIRYLKRAIQLKSDAYLSFYSLGVAYYKKGDYKEAKQQFLKVYEINPDFEPVKKYLQELSD